MVWRWPERGGGGNHALRMREVEGSAAARRGDGGEER